ncbi:MAG: hypothetical protein AB8H86_33655 [Polyangiales bacterium]
MRQSFLTMLLGITLVSACGGTSYAGGVYRDGAVHFAVEAPSGPWRSTEVEGAHDLAWTHSESAAVIHVGGSCDPRLDLPLPALTNHLLIGFTEREVLSEERRPFQGREALDSHVVAKLDGVVRELRLLVLKKDDCVYDFALVSSRSAFADANVTFTGVIDSFEAR